MATTLNTAPKAGYDLDPMPESSVSNTDIGALALGEEAVMSKLPDLSHMSLAALFDPRYEAALTGCMPRLDPPEKPSIGGHNS